MTSYDRVLELAAGHAARYRASLAERPVRVPLFHGDVAVWGGADRLRFHGVAPIALAQHPLTGAERINVTLRKAG